MARAAAPAAAGLLLLLLLLGAAAGQPLHDAAAEGDLERVQTLLARPGTNVNQPNKDGWTPLHEAAARHYEAVCEALVAAGPPPSPRSPAARRALATSHDRRRRRQGPSWTRRTRTAGRRCTRRRPAG